MQGNRGGLTPGADGGHGAGRKRLERARWLRRVVCGLGIVLAAYGLLAANALAATPTLFTVTTTKPQLLAGGAEKAWPIKLSEDQAMTAVFQGGMWVPNPAGGRIYAKYQRHIIHRDGTWTWVGTVATVHGKQSVMFTFGAHGVVFGYVPQASGWPLRIDTRRGETRIIATDGKALMRSPEWLRMHAKPDYVFPPPPKSEAEAVKWQALAAAPPVAASAAAPVTITLMVAYTPGLVTAYGSQSAAVARIQYLVDWANQAYVNSNVYQQLDLVHTVEVDYPDNNSDTAALADLANPSGSTNPAASALLQIPALRAQYGADLVSMVRPFDQAAAAANECGVGYLGGAGGTALSPSSGYSMVSDIADSTVTTGVSCADYTLAHELGHNMGNDHDRATAMGSGEGSSPAGGAYPYSFGYKSSTFGFYTIMAYGDVGETPMQVFSNPDVSSCNNSPCGVADDSPDSADNAHSMNNTAPLVAQYEPGGGGGPASWTDYPYTRNDVTGDGHSDLLWVNTGANLFGYWRMNGAGVTGLWTVPVAAGYRVVATGDFNADGRVDLVWIGPNNDMYLWLSNGTSFTSQSIGTLPAGNQIVGAGNFCGCSPSGLLFFDAATDVLGYRAMNGATTAALWSTPVTPGYSIAAIGDFNGDGITDLLWTSSKHDLYMWEGKGGGGFNAYYVGTYPAGWTVAGAGDIDGDGKDDILWRNQGTGQFGYWIMNGPQVVRIWSTAASSAYRIAALGDFNGDYKVDVIWTSAANDLYLWSGTGTGFDAQYIGSYPAGWGVIPSQLMSESLHPYWAGQ